MTGYFQSLHMHLRVHIPALACASTMQLAMYMTKSRCHILLSLHALEDSECTKEVNEDGVCCRSERLSTETGSCCVVVVMELSKPINAVLRRHTFSWSLAGICKIYRVIADAFLFFGTSLLVELGSLGLSFTTQLALVAINADSCGVHLRYCN